MSKELLAEETWFVISDVREELEDVKCVWRVDVWVESEDREEIVEVREDNEERRE